MPKRTPSRKVPQRLASTTSKWGLNAEEQAALLRVRTGSECPEGNRRELTRYQLKLWDSKRERKLTGEKHANQTHC